MADEQDRLQTAGEAKDSTGDFKLKQQDLVDLLTGLDEQVTTAHTAREPWATQLENNHKWRKGRIGRPHPNLPFRGAADIRFPLSDVIIKELKPGFSQSIRSATRPVRLLPEDPARYESAERIEHWFAHILKGKVKNWANTVDTNADGGLESGVAILKTTWDQRREPIAKTYLWEEIDAIRSGFQQKKAKLLAGLGSIPQELDDEELLVGLAQTWGLNPKDAEDRRRLQDCIRQYNEGEEGDGLTVFMDDLTHNEPVIQNIDEPQSITVDVNSPANIQEAEWIAHDMPVSERELIDNSVENGGRYSNVHELLEEIKNAHDMKRLGRERKYSQSENQQLEEMRDVLSETEGISPTRELRGCITLREYYCWLPRRVITRWREEPGDDETMVRAVITYLPNMPQKSNRVLLMRELPYDHRKWPFANYIRNRSKNRYYSGQGVPEEINALEREYNIQKNGAINRDLWSSSPPVLVNGDAKISLSMYRTLGQEIKVGGGVDPRLAAVPLALPNVSEAWDRNADESRQWAEQMAGVPNLQSLGTFGNPPTAEQVQQTVAPANAISTFELGNYHEQWAEAYTQVFELARQYLFAGDSDRKLQIPNADNPRDGTITLTKEDFMGEYIIRPGGDVTLESPMLKAQKTAFAIQMVMSNKVFLTGVKPYDALNLFLSRSLGYDEAQIIIRDRKAAEQMDQEVKQMAAQMFAAEQSGKKRGGGKPPQLPTGFTGIAPQRQVA